MWLQLVMQGVLEIASQWYSKCCCVASVTKTFTPKGLQTIHLSEPSMETSQRLPKPVSKKQLINRVTNNRNSTGNVTSSFYEYFGFTSRDQQKYRRKTSQSARCLRLVNTYISSSAVRVFARHVL
jgi:hypothetical protein